MVLRLSVIAAAFVFSGVLSAKEIFHKNCKLNILSDMIHIPTDDFKLKTSIRSQIENGLIARGYKIVKVDPRKYYETYDSDSLGMFNMGSYCNDKKFLKPCGASANILIDTEVDDDVDDDHEMVISASAVERRVAVDSTNVFQKAVLKLPSCVVE